MLTEEEKAKLKAEEIYRNELRNEIAQAKVETLRNRIWATVNSSIFLWFLSTVAVGGITYVWTVKQNEAANARLESQKIREADTARLTQINRLNLEIEGRLSQFIVDVKQMVEKDCNGTLYEAPYRLKTPHTVADIYEKWKLMKAPPRNERTASLIYPDFADRGIVSLIIELDNLQRVSKTEVSRDTRSLRMVVVTIQDDQIFRDCDKNQDGFLPIWIAFRDQVLKKEWSTMFPYTDCDGPFPFC